MILEAKEKREHHREICFRGSSKETLWRRFLISATWSAGWPRGSV
jgi:hypothetical protein